MSNLNEIQKKNTPLIYSSPQARTHATPMTLVPPSNLNQASSKFPPFSIESASSLQNTRGGRMMQSINNLSSILNKKASYALGIAVTYVGKAAVPFFILGCIATFSFIGAGLGAPGHIPGVAAGFVLGGLLGLRIGFSLANLVTNYSEKLGNYLKESPVETLYDRLSEASQEGLFT